MWIPSLMEITGNEKVDKVATKAACEKIKNMPIPVGKVKAYMKSKIREK